jgi:hypothetical protein
MMKDITFAGQDLQLHHAGILYWPAEKLAVVSDLHLEKASFFAARGQMLPPHDSRATLEKLLDALDEVRPQRLLLLGDSFHDVNGLERLDDLSLMLFERIIAQYELIWITGNHDPYIGHERLSALDEYSCNGLVFRHEAAINAANIGGEISGHYHPKHTLRRHGAKVSKPCFVLNKQRLIMPSFGVLTGGLEITASPIKEVIGFDFEAYLLGRDKVYGVR